MRDAGSQLRGIYGGGRRTLGFWFGPLGGREEGDPELREMGPGGLLRGWAGTVPVSGRASRAYLAEPAVRACFRFYPLNQTPSLEQMQEWSFQRGVDSFPPPRSQSSSFPLPGSRSWVRLLSSTLLLVWLLPSTPTSVPVSFPPPHSSQSGSFPPPRSRSSVPLLPSIPTSVPVSFPPPHSSRSCSFPSPRSPSGEAARAGLRVALGCPVPPFLPRTR